MFTPGFLEAFVDLRRQTPDVLWAEFCQLLLEFESGLQVDELLGRLRTTTSADFVFKARSLLLRFGKTDWNALGLALELAGQVLRLEDVRNTTELVWTGPAPTTLRRLEQVMYDLIYGASKRILLVTFAASHIKYLNQALEVSLSKGVQTRLVLEFEATSEGQLSFDAIHAFSDDVLQHAEIFYWPSDKRSRNQNGRLGKLHVKCAVVDDKAIVSSANLTDDAFDRNMELGLLSHKALLAEQLWTHFERLRVEKILEAYT